MAVSDPTGTIATALPTLVRRRGKRPPVAEILRIADELEVDAFVIGLPLTSDGDENEWTLEVRAFGDRLAERGGRPVHYVDERMSAVRAVRVGRGTGCTNRQLVRNDNG